MKKIQNICFYTALYCLYLCCFFMPISTSIMGASAIAMMFFYLFSGEIKKLPQQLKKTPITLLPLLLFILFVVGIFYSAADFEESALIAKKYRELLYFPIVFFILEEAVRRHKKSSPVFYAKMSFLLGAITIMLLSFMMYWNWIPSPRYGYSTIHHIPHSFFIALLAFWTLEYSIEPPAVITTNRLRKIVQISSCILFVLAVVNLIFVAPGRTGSAVFIALVLLTIFRRLQWKHCILAICLVVAILFGGYKSSNIFSLRVNKAINDLKTYQPGISRSSLGMRFDWWRNSFTLIKQKPLTGHGTGSFRITQKQLVQGQKTQLSDNPHNEYLMIAVQLGLLGEVFFLALFASLIAYSYRLPQEDRNLLQGSMLAFAWGCMANSFLLDSHPSHYFMILAAVLCSNNGIVKREEN